MERQFLGVWIPKEIYLNKDLTPTEKLLLAEIHSFSKNGICFASNEHFAQFLGIGKKQVSRLITNLARLGFVKVDLIYKENTKEVEKRTIIPINKDETPPPHISVDPIRVEVDTPPHISVYPHRVEVDTPPHISGDPIRVKAYYKEQDKYTIKEQEKDNKKQTKKSIDKELEQEFEKIWQLYPSKKGKDRAKSSYKTARKNNVSYETIEKGLYKYIDYLEDTGTEYVLNGSTWFNQKRWEDEHTITGINRKPKNATEYLKMKYGGNGYEPNRNGEIIDHYSEVLPEFF